MLYKGLLRTVAASLKNLKEESIRRMNRVEMDSLGTDYEPERKDHEEDAGAREVPEDSPEPAVLVAPTFEENGEDTKSV